MTKDIITLLDGKWEDGTRPKDLYGLHVSRDPANYVDTIIDGLSSEKRRVQSGCAELASLLSEDHPELLYPSLDAFVGNLQAKEPVLRWEAVCTLGNLSRIDAKGLIPIHIDTIASNLDHKSIVLQGHSVRALSKIAKAYPNRAEDILNHLLRSKGSFPGNRIGFIIEAMGNFLAIVALVPRIKEFVEPYTTSDIKVVARKAKRILDMMP